MYCKKCGKEIDNDAVICTSCGCAVDKESIKNGTKKTGVGVLFALFLGILALIISLLLYPANTVERDSFLKGWLWTVIIAIIIIIISIGAST